MKNERSIASLLALAAMTAATSAQVNTLAWTTDDDDDFGFFNSDAGVGANAEGVVSTGNMQMVLFDRLGNELDSRQVGDTDWPFLRIDTFVGTGANDFPSRFFDPQVEYHTQSGRLWMVYSETNGRRPTTAGTQVFGSGDNDLSALHIAISKSMEGLNELDSLGTEDWWIYSGDFLTATYADTYFNLQDELIVPYRAGAHAPYSSLGGVGSTSGIVDKPQISIDEQAAYILSLAGFRECMVIIPTSHGTGGTLSILEGEKPPASTWTFMRFNELEADTFTTPAGLAGVNDGHEYHYAVQEPFEEVEFENRQFVLSLPPTPIGSPGVDIRIGCMWLDGSQWQYAQSTRFGTGTPAPIELDDPIVGTGFEYFQQPTVEPQTPDTGGWGPNVPRALIQGVLVKDANDDPRIFAVHHAARVENTTAPEPGDQFVVQWYVIDPDLAGVEATTVGGWQPSIVAKGRLDAGDGDRYHPVIGVTQQGVAYIEYTYSDATTWPQVRRVTLNSSYTGIVPNSEMTVRTGPSYPYTGSANAWADFAEMQADPVTGCAIWSVHTLVHDPADTTYPNDERDVWLFQTLHNCQNSNLNFDEGTDLYDMAMFNSLYSAGARRVDMNVDGDVDSTDAAIYTDAYDAATGP